MRVTTQDYLIQSRVCNNWYTVMIYFKLHVCCLSIYITPSLGRFYAAGDGKFYIDPNTGVLFTTPQNLDRETKDLYNLTLTATDPGNNEVRHH